MPYDKDTPLNINESFSVSQPKITANFQEIDTLIAVDHETFGAVVDYGKHKKVLFTMQGADAGTGATEFALYTKDTGGIPELYLRMENNGVVFNMTPSPTCHDASGSETLPSGLKMIWGSGIATGTGATITFAYGGFSTAVYQVILSRNGLTTVVTNTFVVHGSQTTTTFIAEARNPDGTPSTASISYFAIGK